MKITNRFDTLLISNAIDQLWLYTYAFDASDYDIAEYNKAKALLEKHEIDVEHAIKTHDMHLRRREGVQPRIIDMPAPY